MAETAKTIRCYLEIGAKKTFAGSLDWPGWCRSGRDEAAALEALFAYAPRYEKVVCPAGFPFKPPAQPTSLVVVERLKGNTTTDFGAPDGSPSVDLQLVDAAALEWHQNLLKASWQALDAACEAAAGQELRKGPRGGGRALEQITRHVLGAEAGYASRVGRKLQKGSEDDASLVRQQILEFLAALAEASRARGEVYVPERGPRGGKRWSPRFYVRRMVWHVLDHAWEIEDRTG